MFDFTSRLHIKNDFEWGFRGNYSTDTRFKVTIL